MSTQVPYYPYFRGKQFELILLREEAEFIGRHGIRPIVEPVKRGLSSLARALQPLLGNRTTSPIVIVNPAVGEFAERGGNLSYSLPYEFFAERAVAPAVLLSPHVSEQEVLELVGRFATLRPMLVHDGYAHIEGIQSIAKEFELGGHIFCGDVLDVRYRKRFSREPRVLLQDGFPQRTSNRAHGEAAETRFSGLHAVFSEFGLQGFGDYSIVGKPFREGGGPAYAVAIHLTYVDSEGDLAIQHFVSDRVDSPVDPAGKFQEALAKLVTWFNVTSPANQTDAAREFCALYVAGHFPGLGVVKKLSMKHHLEMVVRAYEREQASP